MLRNVGLHFFSVMLAGASVAHCAAADGLPAFPGAEGFGSTTPGGRGGRVLFVTNLSDDGPGSLRAACAAEGKRMIVFRVGGVILLKSGIRISHPFVTIAGQTAPGGGVTLRNHVENNDPPIVVRTHDVVLRYLTVRPGASRKRTCCLRGIALLNGAHHVMVDHCSISWAGDENFTTWAGVHDCTLQWTILSEALRDSNHIKGPHSMGALLGDEKSHSLTLHHNLFAHNFGRNPRIKCSGVVNVINNLIYNSGGMKNGDWGASHVSGAVSVNYIGNHFLAGPDTKTTNYYVTAADEAKIFLQGNLTPERPEENENQIEGVIRSKFAGHVVGTRFDGGQMAADDAATARVEILESAGNVAAVDAAGKWRLRRDAVDLRVVDEVKNKRGRIIDSPADVGGWAPILSGKPPADSDRDGMPDEWETRHRFDPENAADAQADADGDGYTNIEEYLNGTEPR